MGTTERTATVFVEVVRRLIESHLSRLKVARFIARSDQVNTITAVAASASAIARIKIRQTFGRVSK